ncbi:MAG: HAMP domain-containing histidine kinase [Firmicutes bacterium]|nr:HAMP domain-containing histidine kinase [Bacillota bacterium]
MKDAIAGISHDLRTPLTAICGYLDLLEQEPLAEPAARYLAQIQNRTEALKALTEELFRYSIAASSQPLVPVPLDLRGALEEALLSFYGAMEQRNITPEIQLPESRVERCLDPSALSRIFSNILGNALNTAVETSLSAWTRREPLSLPTPQQVSPPSPPGDSLIASTPSKPAAAPLAWVCPLPNS